MYTIWSSWFREIVMLYIWSLEIINIESLDRRVLYQNNHM